MISKVSSGNRKNGEITVEVTLSVVLTVVVLFLVLALFSDNLSTMAANSGIRNMFNRGNVTSNWGTQGSNKTEVNVNNPNSTQVDYEIVADQGLDYYKARSQALIDYYNSIAPATLTAPQKENLAKAATIATILNNGKSSSSSVSSVNYDMYLNQYGIDVTFRPASELYNTSVNGQTYQYNYDLDKLAAINQIINW